MGPCAIELVLEFLHGVCCRRQDGTYDVIDADPVISIPVESICDGVRDRALTILTVCSVAAETLPGGLAAAMASQFSSSAFARLIALLRSLPVRTPAGWRSEELVRPATGEVAATRIRPAPPPCNAPLHEHSQRFVLALLHRLVCAITCRSSRIQPRSTMTTV